MIHVQLVDRQHVDGTALAGNIIGLDTRNMGHVFAKLGQEFPRERRMLSFKHPGTIVFAQDDQKRLIGYLEFGPGWDDPKEFYVSSIQIAPNHRNGGVLLLLIRHATKTIEMKSGVAVRTHVQENNPLAIRLLEKVGFVIDRSLARRGTISATMILPMKWPGRRMRASGDS